MLEYAFKDDSPGESNYKPTWDIWPYGLTNIGAADHAIFQFRIGETTYRERTPEFEKELLKLISWEEVWSDLSEV